MHYKQNIIYINEKFIEEDIVKQSKDHPECRQINMSSDENSEGKYHDIYIFPLLVVFAF
jgi:hypothetical protein